MMTPTAAARLAAVIIWAALAAGVSAQPPAALPQGQEKEILERVRELREDISTINLLNGLNLTREQSAKILELAKQARQAREQIFQTPENLVVLKEAEEAFRALKAEVQKGAPARGDVPQRAAQADQRLKERRDQLGQRLNEQYRALEARLNQVLSPEQAQVAQNFSPCLIPPLDLRNPVRAGQAAAPQAGVNLMRRVRSFSEAQWQARKNNITQRLVNQQSKHYRLTDPEKAAEKARLLALLERARSMSDMDFEMEKESLAQEMKPRDRLKELREELQARSPHQGRPHLSKVGNFLLAERLIPILEQRLNQKAAQENQ